ncbi:DUF4351 domain-containing protein [Coxiella burnetii]|uniref:DUF4351 domain-containing protein n=2 Tax=Coxiella burnetii TaxID=777 RepID=UPI000183CF9D|nr:DUF4351 domain-containing protein [Coxiella burnetii]ACJ18947.1 hypothetical cytosolic protein [Coxiella burnetii CbuG_Q212]ATN67303.1 hypothetical protein AYM17_08150 [Coxiella burnetii]OYK85487.1 DUF4351 domain-containing protein [Coxiella burnetii]
MAVVYQSKDTAWKEILEAYFKEFIALCLPDLDKLIDWKQPYESLDKELLAITKEGLTEKRILDKLFQVYFRSGQEQWVLIHLEIQGQVEAQFPRRMLVYGYRIYDKYQKPVVSCAILTDQNPKWRPDHYEIALAGSRLRMDFRVVKLLDYAKSEVELEHSTNPFASVILSYLAATKVKRAPEAIRLQTKLSLTKRLYRKGYTKAQIIRLYIFIDWLIHLPKAFEIEYRETVYQWEENNMAYISSIERFGIQKGLQQGRQEGEYALLLRQLQRKFHGVPADYRQKLEKADVETLLKWGERLIDASTLEEVFHD